ncbi:hypothetical protein BMAA0935 [Burkholderia mallei ATCC 23344]|uniref:Uncharacterized protein n=1 Tax=Burkholderia mallei (strain ATCC 23344) TaxID=243160 RepID=A0A0H2WB01_BURMA|nr:hypothetical protein BMAA0935 [Burkholderia mallei ATCC 23344]MBK3336806.1 hypothetical protein [Burkholderia pseudomallei]QBL84558.1 hypothetical protein EYA88_08805 [Burkholderia pseudomallei]RPE06838.1 hypothetical protein DF127_34965 [Burkholderia pseudomallei]RPE15898.1 hypothetical protein DF068_34325 [Burkholderia pseudomallei]
MRCRARSIIAGDSYGNLKGGRCVCMKTCACGTSFACARPLAERRGFKASSAGPRALGDAYRQTNRAPSAGPRIRSPRRARRGKAAE